MEFSCVKCEGRIRMRLLKTRAGGLQGLEEGVVPIAPSFKIVHGIEKQATCTIQSPPTGANVFTDYRSQGQTIPYVIADLLLAVLLHSMHASHYLVQGRPATFGCCMIFFLFSIYCTRGCSRALRITGGKTVCWWKTRRRKIINVLLPGTANETTGLRRSPTTQ